MVTGVDLRLKENAKMKGDYYDFIIITPEIFSVELQPLRNHKEQHDIANNIVTLEEE